MSPRTNCCTAKLSWDFLLLQNGRRERSALFLFDKVSYNARYMKIRGAKNASFPGFGPFRLQRPVFASSVCLVCICVLLCFTPVSCVYFYLVLFSLASDYLLFPWFHWPSGPTLESKFKPRFEFKQAILSESWSSFFENFVLIKMPSRLFIARLLRHRCL